MSTYRLTPTLISVTFASVLGTAAVAQETPPPQPPKTPTAAFMAELDKDGDGQVSLEEIKAPQQQRFEETDADGDGVISTEEAREAFAKQVPPEMLKQMRDRGMPDPGDTFVENLDTNDDQQVSAEEFVQPAVDSFNRMDTNGDGLADAEESTAFFEEMQQEMRKRMQELQQQHQQMQPPAEAPAQE